jgi:hypothetical protein
MEYETVHIQIDDSTIAKATDVWEIIHRFGGQ